MNDAINPDVQPESIDLPAGTTVLRAVGSEAEPYISHNQPVVAVPASKVRGADFYVRYSHADQAHLIVWIEPDAEGITMCSHGERTTYRPTDKPDVWKLPSWGTERFRIVGRVVGALEPPMRDRARQTELMRAMRDA